MTQEQKAKAYDEALERAKDGLTDKRFCETEDTIRSVVEYIFPQLTESDDERIREEMIRYFTEMKKGGSAALPYDDCIAYLEKQKEQKQEHFELKAGHWYICHRAFCCRADHLTVKEGERFMCEKDGVVKGFVIKEPEKYFKECSAPAPMEDEQKEQKPSANQKSEKPINPSSKFHPGDWVVYDGPLGHGIFQVKDVVDGRYTFVDNDSTLLEEDSDKFLRPLTPKDVEGKQKPSAEDVLTKAGLKPYKDGNQWCILAGDNIQEGICGFGDTIEDALYEFLIDVLNTQKEQKPLTTEETELNSIAFLEQMGYTCIPPGKEQNPAEWSEEDKDLLLSTKCIIDEVWHSENTFGYSKEELEEIWNWLNVAWTRLEYPKENDEWSEEDEVYLQDALWCVKQASKVARGENDMGACWSAERWLKSLRPQPKQEQNDYITPHKEFFKFIYDRLINVYKENPNVDYMRSFKERLDNLSFEEKQEWNEENEDMLNSCISSIEEAKENRYAYKETDGDTSYDHEIAWLESLRNRVGKEFLQPHWKPSEEQMEALDEYIYAKDPNTEKYSKAVLSLRDELKELM